MSFRELICDHSIENGKMHPATQHVFIGNISVSMCETCLNSLKGQVLEGVLKDFFTNKTVSPIIVKGVLNV